MTFLAERTAKIEALQQKGRTIRIDIMDPVTKCLFETIHAVRDDDGNTYCTNAPLVFGCWGMLIKVRGSSRLTACIEDQDDEVREDFRRLSACRDPLPGWWGRFVHGPDDPKEDYSRVDSNGCDIPDTGTPDEDATDLEVLKARVAVLEQRVLDAECERDACRGMEQAAEMRAERLYKERERLRECNNVMREPMRRLREATGLFAQGEGFVQPSLKQ